MMTAKARGKNQVVFFDDSATERPGGARRPRRGHPLDRAPEDAPVARRQAQPLERRARDRHGDRERAPPADRLPQLPHLRPRRRGARADRLPGRADRPRPDRRPRSSAPASARASPAASSRPASRCCSRTRRSASSRSRSRARPQIEESIIAVPLNYGTRVIGAIVVSKLGLDQFDEDDLRLLEVLAGHAAVALENAQPLRGAAARGREREGAARVRPRPRRGGRSRPRARARRRGRRAADRRAARVALAAGARDAATSSARRRRLRGRTRDRPPLRRADDRAVRRAARAVHARPEQYAAFSDPPSRESARTVAPVHVRGPLGRIAVAATGDVDFGDRELELVGGLAHQAKLAIANASSFAGLERTFLSTVEALANALEARDEYTSSHARWITDTALRVGQELGLDGDTLKRLELGALFHDIGKIGIPNSVLLKPGPLTDGGARADRDAPGARREDHRPDRPAAGRLRDRARLPRALGRPGLSRTGRPATRSRSRRGSSSPATPSTR